MKGVYSNRSDHFESLTRRTFGHALLRLLEQEYKLLGSRRVLEMLVEDVEALQGEFFADPSRLEPGTIGWVTTKKTTQKPSYGKRTEDYETVTVYLPLWTRADIEKRVFLRDRDRHTHYEQSKRRDIATLVRLIKSAFEQGGMLSQAELAVLTNRSLTTIRRYLAEYQAHHPDETLPLKGYLLDQGSRPTHKGIILTLYEQGIDPLEVSRRTEHGLEAVDRYIKAYERVKALVRKDMNRQEIKQISGLGHQTVAAYLRIVGQFHPTLKQRPAFQLPDETSKTPK